MAIVPKKKKVLLTGSTWPFPAEGSPVHQVMLNENANAAGSSSSTKRNPDWTRDELILALQLYLSNRSSPPGKESAQVKEFSDFLGRLGVSLGMSDEGTFRNANGVYMKMMNFRRFDPEYTNSGKVGLDRGNKDEEVVWTMFANDSVRLQQVAKAIRGSVDSKDAKHVVSNLDDGINGAEAEEGKVLTRLHRFRERNRDLVQKRKQRALKQYGRLFCEACEFDFSAVYGDAGEGIIEVHHAKPVHTLIEGDKTTLDDLILLCANCHRVVHRTSRWLTLDQLKAAVGSPAHNQPDSGNNEAYGDERQR